MLRISSVELQRQWGHFQDMAMLEPITVTSNGRDRIVVLSKSEYERLKRRDREILTLADFTEEDLRVIKASQAPEAAATFDHEVSL